MTRASRGATTVSPAYSRPAARNATVDATSGHSGAVPVVSR
jgi:hypothetical protein